MNKKAWAVTAVGLALLVQTSIAHAGGWHGYNGHGNCGGYYGHGSYYHGHSSSDAAIIAATLFGTAAVINAFTVPQYSPPPVAYYPAPPPVVYYPAPPVVYYPAPVAYYPPAPVYYPGAYYYPPR